MSDIRANRIEPLEAPYNDEVQDCFNVVMPEGMAPLNIFRTMAHNPRVLSRMVQGGLLDRGSISVADRELVILRSCAVCKAEYEWGVHVAIFAEQAGFSEAQIADTCANTVEVSLWSDSQQLLLALADELHAQQKVSAGLWQSLGGHYSAEQLVELVMLAGFYHAVSFVVNAFEIEHEAFAPRFPQG